MFDINNHKTEVRVEEKGLIFIYLPDRSNKNKVYKGMTVIVYEIENDEKPIKLSPIQIKKVNHKARELGAHKVQIVGLKH